LFAFVGWQPLINGAFAPGNWYWKGILTNARSQRAFERW